MNWLALDIGGANIKLADGQGFAMIESFPLWQRKAHLVEMLRSLIAGAPKCDHLAATMTGELADCFATKAEGVQFIVQSLMTAADGRHTRIYLHKGMLVSPQIALRQPLQAAAANWHALARFAGRFAKHGSALLIDIGSTTSDLVPMVDGQPRCTGHTDTDRLVSGELVYTGVERSPLCSLASAIPYRGRLCPIAQEVFATAWDIYLVLEDLPEEAASLNTADGRSATRACARERLARMICADRENFNEEDALLASEYWSRQQMARIGTALSQVLGRLDRPPETIIYSGRGEFLARRVLDRMRMPSHGVSLSHELGPHLSRCATAHALAVLAREGNE